MITSGGVCSPCWTPPATRWIGVSVREASASGYRLLHKPIAPITLRAQLNRTLQAGAASGGSAHLA